jgi:protein-disulfide isomerase
LTGQAGTGHKRSMILSLAVVLLVIVVLGAFAWYFLSPSSMSTGGVQPSSTASISSSLATSLLSGTPPTLGSTSAPVTIVEFGDYQCPTCGEWYRSQEVQLIQNLVNSGKAKLVWRDFDYYGPDSVTASIAAYAAGEQGKFWQFHDLLFQSQRSPNSGWASKQNVRVLAQQLGLNMTLFDQSFNSGRFDSLVNSNHELGVQAGVSQTPTFFLIGPNDKIVAIAGDQPESVFEQAVASLTSG